MNIIELINMTHNPLYILLSNKKRIYKKKRRTLLKILLY